MIILHQLLRRYKKRKYNEIKSHRDFLANRLRKFFFTECDEVEIKSIISSLSANKSYGPNGIPTHLLYFLKDQICFPLKLIFNLSLSTGQHPNVFKVAKTILIFKKGSRLEISNYRPISSF